MIQALCVAYLVESENPYLMYTYAANYPEVSDLLVDAMLKTKKIEYVREFARLPISEINKLKLEKHLTLLKLKNE